MAIFIDYEGGGGDGQIGWDWNGWYSGYLHLGVQVPHPHAPACVNVNFFRLVVLVWLEMRFGVGRRWRNWVEVRGRSWCGCGSGGRGVMVVAEERPRVKNIKE